MLSSRTPAREPRFVTHAATKADLKRSPTRSECHACSGDQIVFTSTGLTTSMPGKREKPDRSNVSIPVTPWTFIAATAARLSFPVPDRWPASQAQQQKYALQAGEFRGCGGWRHAQSVVIGRPRGQPTTRPGSEALICRSRPCAVRDLMALRTTGSCRCCSCRLQSRMLVRTSIRQA